MTDHLKNYNLVNKLVDQKINEGGAKGHFGYATATGFLTVQMNHLLDLLEIHAPKRYEQEKELLQSLLTDATQDTDTN